MERKRSWREFGNSNSDFELRDSIINFLRNRESHRETMIFTTEIILCNPELGMMVR